MHVVPEAMKRPSKGRLPMEKALKWINKMLLALQLACLLYCIASQQVSANKTFETSMWGSGPLVLKQSLSDITSNCTAYNLTLSEGGFSGVPFQISSRNVIWRFIRLIYATQKMIVVAAVTIVAGGINKVLFDLNVFHWRYNYFIVRKDLLSAAEIILLGFCIVCTSDVDEQSADLRGYLKHCGVVSDSTLPYNAPYIEIYVSCAIVLFAHALTLLAHLVNANSESLKPSEPAFEPHDQEPEHLPPSTRSRGGPRDFHSDEVVLNESPHRRRRHRKSRKALAADEGAMAGDGAAMADEGGNGDELMDGNGGADDKLHRSHGRSYRSRRSDEYYYDENEEAEQYPADALAAEGSGADPL